uniref:Proteasome endopeptidase complex n=1 Tax=Aegilops tauschii TaxID=37682 RepID=M8BND3_AEGTA
MGLAHLMQAGTGLPLPRFEFDTKASAKTTTLASCPSGPCAYLKPHSPPSCATSRSRRSAVDATSSARQDRTIVGIKCKDGIVLGVEKLITSKMILAGSNRRLHSVHRNSGLAVAGLAADGRQIVSRAKSEAANYEKVYGEPMPVKELADRVASYVHLCTLYWWLRPFGCGVILGGYDRDGPQLYMIEPSGLSYKYFGAALGKGRQAAKTHLLKYLERQTFRNGGTITVIFYENWEIEKLKLSELTCREGIVEVAKIIYGVHDEAKDKSFELELSWVCEESNRQHEKVPSDLLEQAKAAAQAALEEMDAD